MLRNTNINRIRIVTEMVGDLDANARVQFYKSMLLNNQDTGNRLNDIKADLLAEFSFPDESKISQLEYSIINEIADSMEEINYLLDFEGLLLNP